MLMCFIFNIFGFKTDTESIVTVLMTSTDSHKLTQDQKYTLSNELEWYKPIIREQIRSEQKLFKNMKK